VYCAQILRVVADGDKCDVIYLPPRTAGDRLPVELLDAYEGLDFYTASYKGWHHQAPRDWTRNFCENYVENFYNTPYLIPNIE